MKQTFKSIILGIIFSSIFLVFNSQYHLIMPEKSKENVTLIKLKHIGIHSEDVAEAIDITSKRCDIEPEFLIALIYTESAGKKYAVSDKGYHGYGQIPWPVYYADANILISGHIFNEKMKIRNNNLKEAICSYKGYKIDSERGKKKAQEVLNLYYKLQKIKV